MKEKHTYNHADASGKLPAALRANPYTVPNGYFENVHHRTIQRCQNAGNTPSAFDVPAGYFEQLADNITAKIAEQELKTFVNDPGFVVPNSYFSQLEQRMAAHRKIDENVTDTGFTTPSHYFDSLPNQIRARTHQTGTPIRKIGRPKWIAYATAASIAVVLGLVGLFRTVDETSETKSPLASVSDQQILEYLELYGTTNDMIYSAEEVDGFDEQGVGEGISEEDIEAYLNHTL